MNLSKLQEILEDREAWNARLWVWNTWVWKRVRHDLSTEQQLWVMPVLVAGGKTTKRGSLYLKDLSLVSPQKLVT